MELTPTQSMSAPLACAGRKTLRPLCPRPWMPACKAIRLLPGPWSGAGESIASWAPRRFVDVAVDDVDQDVPARGVEARQLLGDHHGAVPPAGAADPHGQVGLALLLVGRQQVVEQRGEPLVELGDAV